MATHIWPLNFHRSRASSSVPPGHGGVQACKYTSPLGPARAPGARGGHVTKARSHVSQLTLFTGTLSALEPFISRIQRVPVLWHVLWRIVFKLNLISSRYLSAMEADPPEPNRSSEIPLVKWSTGRGSNSTQRRRDRAVPLILPGMTPSPGASQLYIATRRRKQLPINGL